MTIAHIYKSLSGGGMQRGAGAILQVHHAMGARLVVLTRDEPSETDYPIPVPFTRFTIGGGSYRSRADAGRRQKLKDAILGRGCDLVIHHEYYARSLVDDMEVLQDLGVPVLVQWHSCFSALNLSPWWNGHVCEQLEGVKRYAHGVLTLSAVDRTFFELLGVPAVHIPYSDPDLFTAVPVHGEGRGTNILWTARFSMGKRPVLAVQIFEKVLQRCPDARLCMLGDGPLRGEVDAYLATRPQVRQRVSFPGFINDVTPFLKDADVFLVTSEFEGFCHSIVEAKMAALPTVGFAMDYLDTTRSGTGYCSVPQGDVAAAAGKVCELLEDANERKRLGRLAREDFERFSKFDQQSLYREAFQLAVEKKNRVRADVTTPSLVPCVLDVLLEHVDAEWQKCVGPRAKAASVRARSRSLIGSVCGKLAHFFARLAHK